MSISLTEPVLLPVEYRQIAASLSYDNLSKLRITSEAKNGGVVSLAHERRYLLQRNALVAQEQRLKERDAYREERRQVAQCGKQEEALSKRLELWMEIAHAVRSICHFEVSLRRQRALCLLRCLLGPILTRYIHRRRTTKDVLTQAQKLRKTYSVPLAEELTAEPLFQGWAVPALNKVLAAMEPREFAANEYIFFQGDPGDKLYFIASGAVDVIVRKEGGTKCRTKENGTIVARLQAGDYFGEYALLTNAPRMATILSTAATVCWTIPRSALLQQLSDICPSGYLHQHMVDVANTRQQPNMFLLCPLQAEALAELPLFHNWTTEQLEAIITEVQPVVKEAGQVLFRQGSAPEFVYFIMCGQVELWQRSTPNISSSSESDRTTDQLLGTLEAGDVVGEIGCICLEPQPYSAHVSSKAQLWSLPRHLWKEIMLSHVPSFLHAKEVVNKQRAKWISALPKDVLLNCTALQEALGTLTEELIGMVQELLVPVVLSTGDVLENPGIAFVMVGSLSSNARCSVFTAGMCIEADQNTEVFKAQCYSEIWLLQDVNLSMLQLLTPRSSFFKLRVGSPVRRTKSEILPDVPSETNIGLPASPSQFDFRSISQQEEDDDSETSSPLFNRPSALIAPFQGAAWKLCKKVKANGGDSTSPADSPQNLSPAPRRLSKGLDARPIKGVTPPGFSANMGQAADPRRRRSSSFTSQGKRSSVSHGSPGPQLPPRRQAVSALELGARMGDASSATQSPNGSPVTRISPRSKCTLTRRQSSKPIIGIPMSPSQPVLFSSLASGQTKVQRAAIRG